MEDLKHLENFYIHLDVPNHYIEYEDFINHSKNLKIILEEFNNYLFKEKLKIKFLISPPQKGGILEIFGVEGVIGGGVIGAFAFIKTEEGKRFVKGLTGKEPIYWFEKSGENLRSLIVLLRDITKIFLEKKSQEIVVDWENSFKLIEAKNNFWKNCQEIEGIKGVEFSDEYKFSIKKEDFKERIQELENKPVIEYRLHKLIITNPSTSASSEAQWKAKDFETEAFINFHMNDSQFLLDFLNNGKYPLKEHKVDDVITALIEYQIEKNTGKIIKKSAEKIYKFNETLIEEIPKNISIEIIEKIKQKIPEGQDNLFSAFNIELETKKSSSSPNKPQQIFSPKNHD